MLPGSVLFRGTHVTELKEKTGIQSVSHLSEWGTGFLNNL